MSNPPIQYVNIIPHDDFIDRAKFTYEKYDLINIIADGEPAYSKRALPPASKRVCLFCGRTSGHTKFSNYSHLVPQLIGNGSLYSSFECDACNEGFSKLENDFANYLGVSRSITGLLTNRNMQGFKARKLSAKSRSFMGNDMLIIAPEDIQRDGHRSTITYTKNKFIPSKVYQSLLKSALSVLGANEITRSYPLAISYLNQQFNAAQGAIISGYRLNFESVFPLHMYVFKKKNDSDPLPTHAVTFQFFNHIIDFAIPFHKDDIKHYKNGFQIPAFPPLFVNRQDMINSMPTPFMRDLGSTVEIKDEQEQISFAVNPAQENMVGYDPETGVLTETSYDPDSTRYVILTRNGSSFDPAALSAFLKEFSEKGS